MTKPRQDGGGTGGAADAPGRPALGVCRWCRRPYEPNGGPGRPREFCKRSCRQRDYEARQRARQHGLDESELVVARAELDRLRDGLYVLACAVADVDRDLATVARPGVQDYRDALTWLLEAARPLAAEDAGA